MDSTDKLRLLYLGRGYTRNDFVEQQLYDGFPTVSDKPTKEDTRADTADCVAPAVVKFSDPRYKQLLINYRARVFQLHYLILRCRHGMKIVFLD